MASFAATDKQTVNFNGQSFTRYAIADYQKQLVYFQAAVIREQQTQAALRGEVSGGRVALDFIAAD